MHHMYVYEYSPPRWGGGCRRGGVRLLRLLLLPVLLLWDQGVGATSAHRPARHRVNLSICARSVCVYMHVIKPAWQAQQTGREEGRHEWQTDCQASDIP